MHIRTGNWSWIVFLLAGALALAGCGKKGEDTHSTASFAVGGTVGGLSGTVVLQNNGGDNLSISADGSFTFPTALANSSAYAVTVLSQPADQTCTIANATGTITGANVTNVVVTCATNTFTVGGTVSGLSGTVVLQNNGGDNLSISTNGSFTFATALANNSPYAVTILTQPAGQTCTIVNAAGTIAAVDVTDISITCVTNPPDTFSVSGMVSGLSGTVVLQNNGGDNLSLATNGGFTFPTVLTNSSSYAVTVLTQPTDQTCAVTNGSGMVAGANVTNVAVTCTTNTFTVGGTVSGLAGTVVLQNNGGDNLSISANGSFTFPAALTNGSTYAVTVLTQPTDQTCTVTNGSGTIAGADISNVGVTCTTNTFTIGGTVSGLSGTVVLQNNGGDNLSISTNSSFTFPTALTNSSTYAVTVLTQPAGQTCTVTNSSGTIAGANVTNVAVTCTTNTFSIGGTVSGLAGTVVLQNNGGDNLSISTDGSFTFATALANGSAYTVTVVTQPTDQTCMVTSGSGTITGANVTNVNVTCTTNTFTVGGTVSGLAGTVVLQNNGGDNVSIATNGSFTFPTALTNNSSYAVTVLTQPTDQTCTVTSGSGTIAGANVTNVGVTCTTNTFTVGGTVSGLAGTVVLQNNGGDNLSISANGSFAFPTELANSSAYAVTVLTQPTGQTCTVTNGSGTTTGANVSNVDVTCTTNTFTIGGTVSGLSGTVVLQNNGGDNLSISTNGSFTFATELTNNSAYAVTVFAQPTGQTCTVASGSGTVAGANVTGVAVTCANTFTIGGTVSGLSGRVVLQDNGGDNLSISANGSFTFATALANSSPYAVTVLTQPDDQTCTVASGSGTVTGANVTNVAVTCTTNTFTIGGTVSGLSGTVVLQNNGGNDLSISTNGGFTFSTALANSSAYAVAILTQPTDQTCTVTNGSGTIAGANVTNVSVTCTTNTFTVGGTVSGLTGTVVLQNNGGNDLSISTNGGFTFSTALTNSSAYAVTVLTQPTGQTCTVTNGSGTIAGANVTNVDVTCTTNTFTIGGTVSGLSGTVVLQNNGGDNLSISANGSFAFNTKLTNSSTYAVTVLTQPTDQICAVTNGSGTIAGANVTNVAITCATNTFTVGGTVSGLTGTVVLQNNGGDDLSISTNGSFAFVTGLTNNSSYAVTVLTQPTDQTCTVTNGSGTIAGADISNVGVTCTTNTFTVGGTISGLTGTVVLQNNGGDDLSISTNGSFVFSAALTNSSTYAVTVLTQPADQTCTVTNSTGTIAGANVTNVAVTCTTNTFSIGGTVSGLAGTVVLQNNGGDDLSISANGSFAFNTKLTNSSAYAVTVLTQPTGQTCTVASGSGTIAGADVTNVAVTCVTNTFSIGGTVSGLTGTVVLQNNGGDDLSVSTNGGFTFTTELTNSSAYAVTVRTQPTGQACTVASGSGTVVGADVTDVAVSCTTAPPSGIAVSISPSLGGLTTSQTLALVATVTNDVGGAGVTWTKTGGSFTNETTTSVTFSAATAGSFTITATSIADNSVSASATIGVTDLAGVFTQRNDAQRTGQNRREFALTPGTVSASTFGKLFSCAVDGELYAQPLYVANLAIAGGTHNVVLVATQNDSVYAFDADANPCVQYWQTSFLSTGVTPLPPADTGEDGDINKKLGITGTPVIDPATGTLYVVAKTKETVGTGCSNASPCYVQRLHALDIATGGEKFNGPANISSAITVPGSGDTGDTTCPSSAGNVPFCPLRENQRPGLLLLDGKVYITWASHGDIEPYHGWVIGYNAADLTQAPVLFNTTPNGGLGGIWMSGMAPAADADGNIYVISGNGTFDTSTPRTNYGSSVIRLSTSGGLAVADFFTPANQNSLSAADFDVGSGGAVLLPDSAGSLAHPHLLVGGDKQGLLYVIDRDDMTGFSTGTDLILQEVLVFSGSCITCGMFSTPAFWEGNLYVVAVGDVLKQYTVANAVVSSSPVHQGGEVFGYPGANPVVSSNGATNGIVWLLDTTNNGTPNGSGSDAPAVLYAYNATSLTKLYSSPASSGTGAAGDAVKFTVPTVANGKVYVGTQAEVTVFGLLPN